MEFIINILILLAWGVVALFIHENCHLFACLLTGTKPFMLVMGKKPIIKFNYFAGSKIYISTWCLEGFFSYEHDEKTSDIKELIITMGGPLGDLILAGILFTCTQFFNNEHIYRMLNMSLAIFIFNFFPFIPWKHKAVKYNDGRTILRFFLNKLKKEPKNKKLKPQITRYGFQSDKEVPIQFINNMNRLDILYYYGLGSEFFTEIKNVLNSGTLSSWEYAFFADYAFSTALERNVTNFDTYLYWIEEALKKSPDIIPLQSSYAALLIETGKCEEGLAILKKIRDQINEDYERFFVLNYLTVAYIKTGNSFSASELFTQIEKTKKLNVRLFKKTKKMFKEKFPGKFKWSW